MVARKNGTTVTVDGITVTVDLDMATDYEVVEQATIAADPYATPNEKTASTIRVYKLLLGSDYQRVKNELREQNGGHLPTEKMIEFIGGVIAKVGEAKNSGGSAGK